MAWRSIRPRMPVALGTLVVLCGSWSCGAADPPGEARAPDGGLGTPTTLVITKPIGVKFTGVYASQISGASLRGGLALKVPEVPDEREAEKLLESGRADAAIMGIDTFGRARERGAGLLGIGAIIQPNPKPLPGANETRPAVPYPSEILVTSEDRLKSDPAIIASLVDVLQEGYSYVIVDPVGGLGALLYFQPSLDEDGSRVQLERLLKDGAFVPPLQLDRHEVEVWASSAVRRGALKAPIDIDEAFRFDLSAR